MSTELKQTNEALNRAFEEFKQANDERLAQIEARGSADGALVEKVERLNAEIARLQSAVDEMSVQMQRRSLGAGDRKETPEARQYREAFGSYLRKIGRA